MHPHQPLDLAHWQLNKRIPKAGRRYSALPVNIRQIPPGSTRLRTSPQTTGCVTYMSDVATSPTLCKSLIVPSTNKKKFSRCTSDALVKSRLKRPNPFGTNLNSYGPLGLAIKHVTIRQPLALVSFSIVNRRIFKVIAHTKLVSAAVDFALPAIVAKLTGLKCLR